MSLVAAAAAATALVTSSSLVWRLLRRHRRRQSSTKKEAKEEGTTTGVVLYRFDPPVGQPYGDKSCSPFGIKVETFLRLLGVAYECPPFSITPLLKNEKRKLPCCLIDGVLVADSTFILEYLLQQEKYTTHVQKLLLGEDQLTQQQRAIGVAIKALCEDSLYFIIGYWRYQTDAGFAAYLQCNPTLHAVPQPVRWILERISRRGILQQLWQQGTGRHTPVEVEQLGQQAVDAIEAFLSCGHLFLLGDQPTMYDATLFAFCSAIVEMEVPSPLKDYTLQKPQIMAYIERMNQRCGWT